MVWFYEVFGWYENRVSVTVETNGWLIKMIWLLDDYKMIMKRGWNSSNE
jgi:hypothetical protein